MPSIFNRGIAVFLTGSLALAGSGNLQSQSANPDYRAAAEHGVYLHLATSVPGTFDQVAQRLRAALGSAGMDILADYPIAVNQEECGFRSTVMAVDDPEYRAAAAARGPVAAFALPLRLAVYQDELGTHVAMANPLSLDRTIVAETDFAAESRAVVARVTEAVRAAFPSRVDGAGEYGQLRDEGLIGKTMGIIAGGPFEEQIETIAKVNDAGPAELDAIATRLYRKLEAAGDSRKWKVRPVYRLDLLDHGMVLIGLSGAPIEQRAFQIVGAGTDDTRADMACPGIDHAPAFPIELLLVAVDGRIEVRLIDEMFRMKMYFEDAGRMKFAANMRMPGSIESEIRDKVEESLY